MRALTIFGVVGLLGCSTVEAPVTWKVVEANATHYLVEVTAVPGAEVYLGSDKLAADATGVARFDLPIARVKYLQSATTMHVSVNGRKGLTKYRGEGEVELPFSPDDAASIPTGTNWLRVRGGGKDVVTGERATVWSFGDQGAALLKADGTLELELLGPSNATVTFEGHTGKTDGVGRVTLPFTAEEVLRLIPLGALSAGILGEPAPVRAAVAAGGKPAVAVPLTAYWSQVSGASFRKVFSAPARGGERRTPSLLLYLASDENLVGAGREAPLGEVDVLGLATGAAPRKMKNCEGYQAFKEGKPVGPVRSLPREGVDEEVVALDAHTGQELGRKHFTADAARCPSSKWLSDGKTFQARPKPAEVTAWLSTL